jgi:putative methyltransferase (TIGR04325 family)
MKYAPIVLFVYNRHDHTQKTIEALIANLPAKDSDLIIYSDAPKNQQSVDGVNAVRSFIKHIKGFQSVSIIERDKNWGLANSIIDGVTSVVNKYGKVIVLEDDIVTSPYFLTYMNEALTIYENQEQVISIHGYIYPVKKKLPDYFFLRGADCWGWATWKRGWDIFNPDAQYLLNEIKKQKLEKLFNFYNSYDYTGMLQMQIDGKISSWAVRWYASAFLAEKLTLYPGKSFVKNIGTDGSGTHCGDSDNYNIEFSEYYKPVLPIKTIDSIKARKLFSKYFSKNQKKLHKIKYILKLFIPPIILKVFHSFKNNQKTFGREEVQFNETQLTWDNILHETSNGYNKNQILEKCKTSLLRVKNGEYPYERDSVLFTEKEIFFPLLSSLFFVALKHNNVLNIIDFGGSLGSTYFQNKDILKQTGIKINWNIIEQDSFVKCGNESFINEELKFYNNIDEVLKKTDISVCLLSSVLPYLKEPYNILETVKQSNIKYIIIDRTMFLENESNDILTIQKVPPEIYEASYPAWFLSLNKFYNNIKNDYNILLKWNSLDQHNLENYKTTGLGFLLSGNTNKSGNS